MKRIEITVYRRAWIMLMAAFFAALVAAACGGESQTPDASADQSGSSGAVVTETSAAPRQEPVPGTPETASEAASPSSGAAPSSKLSIEDFDPGDRVAAQEHVLIRLYENLLPSVVHIRVTQGIDADLDSPSNPRFPGIPDIPDDFFQRGEGSGFVWDNEGHIVTNNHVIQDAERVIVAFSDRVEIEATVIGTDPDSDLAVLELQEPKPDARPVVLGDSDDLRVGQMAIAIGNPFGQQFTMTTGIVSALGRTINSSSSVFSNPEAIQTDAQINPGNSGGPLLDRHGRVIGVNTQIISRSGVSSGIGFSVPINTAKRVIPALITDGKYDYSWLGITGTTLSPEIAEEMGLPRGTGGAMVISISGGSPADRAGLRGSDTTIAIDGQDLPTGGDVIVGIDGNAVRDMNELIAHLVSKTRPDDKVVLEVIRDGEGLIDLKVTLGTRPESTP